MIRENDEFRSALAADTFRDGVCPDSLPAGAAHPSLLDAMIVSDIHLGSTNCQAVPLAELLRQILDGEIRMRRLIFNGDVFDSIDFRRLKKHHWKVLSLIRHLSDKIEVIWIAGNHDGGPQKRNIAFGDPGRAEIVSNLLGVSVMGRYILASGSRQILIVHGHQFDRFIENHPILTWLADSAYALLQKADRTHAIARLAKKQSKVFLRCERKVREGAVGLARHLQCDAVICGHTHHAVIDEDGPVHYYNSGCWTERPSHYLTVTDGAIELYEPIEELESAILTRADAGSLSPATDSAVADSVTRDRAGQKA